MPKRTLSKEQFTVLNRLKRQAQTIGYDRHTEVKRVQETEAKWRACTEAGKAAVAAEQKWKSELMSLYKQNETRFDTVVSIAVGKAQTFASSAVLVKACDANGGKLKLQDPSKKKGPYDFPAMRDFTKEELEKDMVEAEDLATKAMADVTSFHERSAKLQAAIAAHKAAEPSTDPFDDGTDEWKAVAAARTSYEDFIAKWHAAQLDRWIQKARFQYPEETPEQHRMRAMREAGEANEED